MDNAQSQGTRGVSVLTAVSGISMYRAAGSGKHGGVSCVLSGTIVALTSVRVA